LLGLVQHFSLLHAMLQHEHRQAHPLPIRLRETDQHNDLPVDNCLIVRKTSLSFHDLNL